MDRRTFLASLAPLGLAFAAIPADAARPETRPYGAARLEDTDTNKLAESLLNQIIRSGRPEPESFEPFPENFAGYPQTTATSIRGESSKYPWLDTVQKALDNDFRGQPHCDELVLNKSFKSWRVFVAYHESSHYLTFHSEQKDGTDIVERVFRKVNNVPYGTSIADYKKSVQDVMKRAAARYADEKLGPEAQYKKIMQDKDVQRVVGANLSVEQIQERIADVSAALCILSNYGEDTAENRAFLGNIRNLRAGYYKDNPTVHIDGGHDTSGSIEMALQEFKKHPQKGLLIDETHEAAAKIIAQRTERKPTVDNTMAARELWDASDFSASPQDAVGLHLADRKQINAEKEKIINARNAACVGSASP